jgi:hypothetical protein
MLKLNIGCGFNKRQGYINVDSQSECEPDVVANLEQPWPFEDNSVEEVYANHALEHMGETTAGFLAIMKEMYRVCADGAKIYIQVPHYQHWTFHSDPTHVRKILPDGLQLFDQQFNRDRIREGHANTPLGLYCGVDFVLEKTTPHYDEPWATRIQNGLIATYDLQFATAHYVNVIAQWDFVLRVRKNHGGDL